MPRIDELRPRLHQIIAEHLGVDPALVTDEAKFGDKALGADSLDIVEIQLHAEEDFCLAKLDDKAFLAIETVGDMLKALVALEAGG